MIFSLINIKKRINLLFKPSYIYIVMLLYVLLVSFVLVKYLHLSGKSISNMYYGFGELVTSLISTGRYEVCPTVCFHAHRFPFVPLFLYLLSFVSSKLVVLLFVKNIIVGLSLIYIFKNILTKNLNYFSLLLILFVLITPQFILHGFNLDYEEPYVMIILALVSYLLLFHQNSNGQGKTNIESVVFGFLVILLFSIKSSLTYLSLFLPLLYFIRHREMRSLIIQYLLLFLFVILWSSFNYVNSGRFTMSSSWNGWNLYKGNNQYTLQYYPKYNLDILDQKGMVEAPLNMTNEWELDNYYTVKAKEFIKKNPAIFIKSAFIKTGTFFFEVRPFGIEWGGKRYDGVLKYFGTFFMVIQRFLFFLTLAVSLFFLKSKVKELKVLAILFLGFIFFYSAPFLIGFAYERHYIPLLLPIVLFLIEFRRVILKNGFVVLKNNFSELNSDTVGNDNLIFLDIDGTVTNDGQHFIDDKILEKIIELTKSNEIYFCSNNNNFERFDKITLATGVACLNIPHKKPNVKILKFIKNDRSLPFLVIGDKFLTDGLFAIRIGARFVMVRRLRSNDDSFLVKVIYLFDDVVFYLVKNIWLI